LSSRAFEQNAFERGYKALKSGDYASAEKLLEQHLQQEPRDPYALLALGVTMERTNRSADALAYYRLANRYGTVFPLKEMAELKTQSDSRARTVGDLALRSITRLKTPGGALLP